MNRRLIIPDWVRFDRIVCPACQTAQQAAVTWKNGDPFPTFIHRCVACGYVIMESEWQPAAAPDQQAPPFDQGLERLS